MFGSRRNPHPLRQRRSRHAPAAPEKRALVPSSIPSGDSREGAAPPEATAVSTPAPASPGETADNPPKSPEPQSVEQALEPEKRQVAARQTAPVADEKEQLDPSVRDLITRGWELYYLPYSAVKWQDARRNFERAFELNRKPPKLGLALPRSCLPNWRMDGPRCCRKTCRGQRTY